MLAGFVESEQEPWRAGGGAGTFAHVGQWRTFDDCAGRAKKGLAQLGGGQALALTNAGSKRR